MIDAIWNSQQGKVWIAYDHQGLVQIAQATRSEPETRKINGHLYADAKVALLVTQFDGLGAYAVFWGSNPVTGRIDSPDFNTLYVILDAARFRALTQLLKGQRHPITGAKIMFMSSPIQGGGMVLYTPYDSEYHQARIGATEDRTAQAVANFRAEKAEAKRPGLGKLDVKWTVEDA